MSAPVSPHEGRKAPEPDKPIATYRDWVKAVQDRNAEQDVKRRKNKRCGY